MRRNGHSLARRSFLGMVISSGWLGSVGCRDTGKLSAEQATQHAAFLVETIAKDVGEVRSGLPGGAEVVAAAWASQPLDSDPKAAADALESARRKVQELRLAKATFFAVTDASGIVIRNDQEQDRMAGKALFPAYPALVQAKDRYTETTGSLPEASGVRAPRADAQWVAGVPVRVGGATKGLYVAGWSWASYAYRLEFALRGKLRTELAGNHEKNEPLVYVYIIDGKAAYGAPVSPEVNAQAIQKFDGLANARESNAFTTTLEITGRAFGLAVRRAPALGAEVGVAVLRSET